MKNAKLLKTFEIKIIIFQKLSNPEKTAYYLIIVILFTPFSADFMKSSKFIPQAPSRKAKTDHDRSQYCRNVLGNIR